MGQKSIPNLPEDPNEFQRVLDKALEQLKEKDKTDSRIGMHFLTGPRIGVMSPEGMPIYMPQVLLREITEILKEERQNETENK